MGPVGPRSRAGVLACTLRWKDAAVLVQVLAQQSVVAGLKIDAVEVQPDQAEGEVGAALVAQHEAAGVQEVPDRAQRGIKGGGGVVRR